MHIGAAISASTEALIPAEVSMTSNTRMAELPMVGRGDELASISNALDALVRGVGGLWLVSGPTGVGKSRLGSMLRDLAGQRGITVAGGRAYAVETGVPYALFADALRPTVLQLDEDALRTLTRGVDELTVLFPWLNPHGARPNVAESADFRGRLHWHFTQFLRSLVARQPLVVILEDLHWADASSVELLHFAARQMADVPLLLYCTINTDQEAPGPALRALLQSPHATMMRLEPLSRDAVEDLVCRVFQTEPQLMRPFAMLLYGWTRGNAFFLAETLKALASTGEITCVDGRWTGWQKLDQVRLPPSVREAVLLRLQELNAAMRDAAEIAAVFGTRFRADTLATVAGMEEDRVVTLLDQLTRANVFEEVISGNEVAYDFVHPMLRQTLYNELGTLRVRALHAKIADALEASYAPASLEHAGELAYHFGRAQGDRATLPKRSRHTISVRLARRPSTSTRTGKQPIILRPRSARRVTRISTSSKTSHKRDSVLASMTMPAPSGNACRSGRFRQATPGAQQLSPAGSDPRAIGVVTSPAR
jgi:predicted ATPase